MPPYHHYFIVLRLRGKQRPFPKEGEEETESIIQTLNKSIKQARRGAITRQIPSQSPSQEKEISFLPSTKLLSLKIRFLFNKCKFTQRRQLQASDVCQMPEVPDTGQPWRISPMHQGHLNWDSPQIFYRHILADGHTQNQKLADTGEEVWRKSVLRQYSGWGNSQSRLLDDSISLTRQCLSFKPLDCSYPGLF